MAELLSQKHFRITDPIINLTMLMVSLPVLICRDPRTMKSAVLVSFALTAACFVTTFVCKMFATEIVLQPRDAGIVGLAARLHLSAHRLHRAGLDEDVTASAPTALK